MLGLVAALSSGLLPGLATASVEGFWLTQNERAVFRLSTCGERMCGRLVWLADPFADDGGPKRDIVNPDPSRRDRPLCGSPLVSGLERAGEGRWEGGRIYNSRDGRTYGLDVELSDPDTLTIRGYLGISLLGRTQKWRRVGTDRGGCPNRFIPGNDR